MCKVPFSFLLSYYYFFFQSMAKVLLLQNLYVSISVLYKRLVAKRRAGPNITGGTMTSIHVVTVTLYR